MRLNVSIPVGEADWSALVRVNEALHFYHNPGSYTNPATRADVRKMMADKVDAIRAEIETKSHFGLEGVSTSVPYGLAADLPVTRFPDAFQGRVKDNYGLVWIMYGSNRAYALGSYFVESHPEDERMVKVVAVAEGDKAMREILEKSVKALPSVQVPRERDVSFDK